MTNSNYKLTKEDVIDPSVGMVMKVRCGDQVKRGDTLCTLYVNDDKNVEDVIKMMHEAIHIEEELCDIPPMVYGVVTEKTINE